ncbi:hypothetical protein [Paenibacillus taichungensis]
MNEKTFLLDIYNRFPRYSSNRTHLERMMMDSRGESALIAKCALKYGLSLNEMSTILDEEGAFTQEGYLNEARLNELAAAVSNWSKKREETMTRHYHQVVNRGASKDRGRTTIKISDVPPTLAGKLDVRSYTELLGKPYDQILEVLAPEPTMIRVYTKLFDKFSINYRVPDEVITAMIHFMLSEQRRWSHSYFEALATDLLSARIENFEAALQHFQNRLNRKEAAISNRGHNERPRGRKPAPKKDISGSPEDRVSEAELEELIRRANEELK